MRLLPRHTLLDFDNAFDNFFTPIKFWDEENVVFSPRVDIQENENQYLISAELPGVKKEDIHVSIDHGILTLEAECRHEHNEEEEGKLVRQERRYGKMVRRFNVGTEVLSTDIEANFTDGVLTLTAPKKMPEETHATMIDVH